MNRSWITALTLATVVGTGGAFVGVISASTEQPVAASPETAAPTALAALVEPTAPLLDAQGTVAYRLDAVGTVTVHVADGQLTVVGSVADPGWSAAAATGAGTHIEATFTDTIQIVTFTADLVGSNVMVSVTNAAVSSATETVATAAPTTRSHATATSPTPPVTTEPNQTTVATQSPAPVVTVPSTTGHDDGGDDEHETHDTEPNDD